MLSRRALLAARTLRAYQAPQMQRQFFPVIQQFRSYADKVVKVPEMAESISEGTLKQFSKQIGDYVEQDEEIATIETDKARLPKHPPQSICRQICWLFYQIDIAVNAPEAGTIKEFLVNEEDTVTVGQDLLRLELGGPPEGGKKNTESEPKKSATSEPAPKKGESESEPAAPEKKSEPKETKPEPKKEAPKAESKKTDSKPAGK